MSEGNVVPIKPPATLQDVDRQLTGIGGIISVMLTVYADHLEKAWLDHDYERFQQILKKMREPL